MIFKQIVLGLILSVAAGAVPVLAQEPVRFPIESIVVEGARREASSGIVVTESLLEEGKSYTERELRDAVYRIKRLPFVLAADFSLRKGSRRGSYELVIAVEETRTFFFGREETLILLSGESPSYALGYTASSDFEATGTRLVGARRFLGSGGVLFGALNVTEGVQVGYTRYGLFGTRAVASLGASISYCCTREAFPLGLDPNLSVLSSRGTEYSTTVAVPLASNHSFRTSLSWSDGKPYSRRAFRDEEGTEDRYAPGGEVNFLELDAKWIYDTTDDPLFPTSGVTLSAGVEVHDLDLSDLRSDPTRFPPEGELLRAVPPQTSARQVAFAASGQKTWALTPRQAFSANLRAAVGESRIENLVVGDELVLEQDLTSFEATAGFEHSWSLWGFEKTRRWGDLRLENFASYGYDQVSPRIGVGIARRFQLGTALAFRNRWGVFRFGISYLNLMGEGR